MIEPTSTKIEVSSGTQTVPITPTPRVYYLPDAQGRMASYYNAMELPDQYTKNHGIPRTNHFIPVGYCCLEEIALGPVSINYLGKNPRNDYRPSGILPPPTLQNMEAKVDAKPTLAKPRAPPSSPESPPQQPVKQVAPPTPKEVEPEQHLVPLTTPAQSSAVSMAPSITNEQPIHQPQGPTAPAPAHPSCPSATWAHHTPPVRLVPHHVPPPTTHVNHATPSPLATRMPAICRRWLIGTCRRGASCRNRHYILDETDAELRRIKDSHLATIQFYNAERVAASKVPTRQDSRKEGKDVEAHVDGLDKVKIPIDVLSSQLQGLKMQGADDGESEVASKPAPLTQAVLISPAISATDSNLEPLPDYTLSMPTVPPPAPRLPTSTIHPAERLRASYTTRSFAPPAHPFHPYSRRNQALVQQDFVPRHFLDRALQQYIAGSLRGRSFLGLRPPSARKRATLAQMSGKSAQAKVKGGAPLVDVKQQAEEKLVPVEQVASAVVKKEEVQKRAWSDEVEAEVAQGKKVETGDSKSAAAPALLVDITRV